jgi:hypothetical protein
MIIPKTQQKIKEKRLINRWKNKFNKIGMEIEN